MENINTKEYWDNRFNTNWELLNGLNQTKDFMECILNSLPVYLKKVFSSNNVTIADIGCGIATGSEVIKNTFPNADVTGIDFSEVALNKNKEMFKEINFRDELDEYYDICISSNVLEHTDDPMNELKNILNHSNKYAIILVPYKEQLGDIEEHIHSFDDDSFPKTINDFKLSFTKIVKTKFWMWEQLLLVYRKGK
jgi:trans-aconitate methyltransferase